MITRYRVMCDRNHPLTPVCDIEHDKSHGQAQLYDQILKGEVPLLNSFGNPAPPTAAMPARRSSGEITIYPQTGARGMSRWCVCRHDQGTQRCRRAPG
jgi:hypothetical protein